MVVFACMNNFNGDCVSELDIIGEEHLYGESNYVRVRLCWRMEPNDTGFSRIILADMMRTLKGRRSYPAASANREADTLSETERRVGH